MTAAPPSVLFTDAADAELPRTQEPAFFADLHLDQVVGALVSGRGEYALAPFFHTPIRTLATVTHRQDVFRDLADPELAAGLAAFGAGLRAMRQQVRQARELHHPYQRESLLVDAIGTYCAAVREVTALLAGRDLRSAGLRAVHEYLAAYAGDARFTALAGSTAALRARLAEIRYSLHISGGRVRVSGYEEQADYGARVVAVFERFRQEDTAGHRAPPAPNLAMNHVEEAVLDRVARLFPEPFAALDAHFAAHRDFLDPVVAAFDREIQFYLAYLDFTAPLKAAGLAFCLPEVDDTAKQTLVRDTFDLALAAKLVREGSPVVLNDVELSGPERVIVVSGPNQGGKTTFARAFGQLHHLAALGCPVPGTQARLFLCDQVFTHFEQGENLADLSGKLYDDLVRTHEILQRATPSSVVVMNEVFTSTTLADAVLLGTSVLRAVVARDLLCVCVTFVDELASLGPSTVSMVSTVAPDDPGHRTYRVVRRPADGLAHALSIAEKYRLTYRQLKARIAS